MVYLHFEIIVFAWNAQCFTIFCVLLHVFLPALSRTLNQYRVVSLVSSCKPVFLILKISQYRELRWQVQLFLKCSCKNWYKNWYLHFPKNYNHQIWQAGTLRGVDSSETNHASAISTTRVPCQQTSENDNLSRWAPAHKLLPIKSWNPLIARSCKITWQTKTIISPLPWCLWPPDLAGVWLTMRGSHPYIQMTIWSRGLMRSCEKLIAS